MSFIKRIIFYAFLIMGFSISPHLIFAQNVSNHLQESYLNPPEEISQQVTAARFKNVFLSKLGPNRKFFVNYIKKANFTDIRSEERRVGKEGRCVREKDHWRRMRRGTQ